MTLLTIFSASILEKEEEEEEEASPLLPAMCNMVLLHFRVGLSLYVIMKWSTTLAIPMEY